MVKKSEKLTQNIKICLKDSEVINEKWIDSNKLASIIDKLYKYENNINYINIINEKVKINNTITINYEIKFTPEQDEVNNFKNKIKNFGNINSNNINDVKILNLMKMNLILIILMKKNMKEIKCNENKSY